MLNETTFRRELDLYKSDFDEDMWIKICEALCVDFDARYIIVGVKDTEAFF
jgi:hypothetical protein